MINVLADNALFQQSVQQAGFADLTSFIPSMLLMATALIVMFMTAIQRNHTFTAIVSCLGLLAALIMQWQQTTGSNPYQTNLFLFDGMSGLVSSVLLLVSLLICVLLFSWLQGFEDHTEEYFLLLLLATQGALIVCASIHFASFFLGLELMGLSLVPMIAYQESNDHALEAGIKYLILSSAASAFILLAVAILYLYTGTLQLAGEAGLLQQLPVMMSDYAGSNSDLIQSCAIILLLAGITFKLSLVPCHLWVADVFEGAPLPASALLASLSKASVFVFLLRIFTLANWQNHADVLEILAFVAAASMLVGNLLALLQTNILRLLAYSSIAHFGYVLLAILALMPVTPLLAPVSANLSDTDGNQLLLATNMAREAAIFYLFAYVVTVIGLFGMLILLPGYHNIEQLTGLFWRQPVIAGMLMLLLLSLAGMPLTIGFVGKFYLVLVAVNNQLWWLLTALVAGSMLGLFYYLRMIMLMFNKHNQSATGDRIPSNSLPLNNLPSNNLSPGGLLVIVVVLVLVLGIGVLPTALVDMINVLV